MAELFGTPLGQLARGAENRAELGFGLNALKTLGEIEAQPGERAYKASLSKLHAADADLKQSEADASRKLQAFASQFHESQAREQLAQGMADQGKIATIADVPKGGVAAAMRKPKSQADMLERLANFIEDKGGSPLSTSKMRDTISDIKEKESRVMSREERAAHQKFLEDTTKRQQLGGIAGWMTASPQNFAMGMVDPQTRALLPKELPPNYDAAKRWLTMIEQTSMDAQKRAELTLNERRTKAQESRAGAANAASAAAAALAKARLGAVNTEVDFRIKNGGERSQSAVDLKKAQQQAAETNAAAKNAEEFPLAPLRKQDMKYGQTYTAPNGQRFKWMLPAGVDDGKRPWGIPDKAADPMLGKAVLLPPNMQPKLVIPKRAAGSGTTSPDDAAMDQEARDAAGLDDD